RFVAAERIRSMLSVVQRSSNRTLIPDAHPLFRNSSRKALTRDCTSSSPGENGIKIPIRRTRSMCCACAASGHATAAPLRSVMNSRRLIVALDAQDAIVAFPARCVKGGSDVRFGSKADLRGRLNHVGYGSVADIGRTGAICPL